MKINSFLHLRTFNDDPVRRFSFCRLQCFMHSWGTAGLLCSFTPYLCSSVTNHVAIIFRLYCTTILHTSLQYLRNVKPLNRCSNFPNCEQCRSKWRPTTLNKVSRGACANVTWYFAAPPLVSRQQASPGGTFACGGCGA